MMHTQTMTANLHVSNDDSDEKPEVSFHIKEPGSAVTHFTGFVVAIVLTPILLLHAAGQQADVKTMISFTVYMISMILLYGASTTYHTFDISEKINLILKKIDHMMIFVLIAGSYTPFCVVSLGGATGRRLLLIVWGLALAGIILKAFWVNCPKWFSSVIYIGMGWVCLLALPQIVASVSTEIFICLLLGGLIYTAGGVIYAMKFPVFHDRFQYFGCHELFHVFVMAGSVCHFIAVYLLI